MITVDLLPARVSWTKAQLETTAEVPVATSRLRMQRPRTLADEQKDLLADKMDLSIDSLSFDRPWKTLTIKLAQRNLDSRDLSRIIQTVIKEEGRDYTFAGMSHDTYTEGGWYGDDEPAQYSQFVLYFSAADEKK